MRKIRKKRDYNNPYMAEPKPARNNIAVTTGHTIGYDWQQEMVYIQKNVEAVGIEGTKT